MKKHLNTLFLTTEGTYLAKEGEALVVRPGDATGAKLRVPIHMLHAVVCFGWIKVSPAAMAMCAERGVSISYHGPTGRLMARVMGFTPGNVLLRRDQFRAAESPDRCLELASAFLQGKIHNTRVLVRRAVRDHGDTNGVLTRLGEALARGLNHLRRADTLDRLRGTEGELARAYWDGFQHLIRTSDAGLAIRGRSRRPPRDPINALLSFGYAILASDVRSALESVGLDSQVGFLHTARAGRPALALDLMEELRPVMADRVVLSLINRGQIAGNDFVSDGGGAVSLSDEARKKFLAEFQRRKDDVLEHPFLGEKVTLGLIPFLQARLLSRTLRGEMDGYPPFLWR